MQKLTLIYFPQNFYLNQLLTVCNYLITDVIICGDFKERKLLNLIIPTNKSIVSEIYKPSNEDINQSPNSLRKLVGTRF